MKLIIQVLVFAFASSVYAGGPGGGEGNRVGGGEGNFSKIGTKEGKKLSNVGKIDPSSKISLKGGEGNREVDKSAFLDIKPSKKVEGGSNGGP